MHIKLIVDCKAKATEDKIDKTWAANSTVQIKTETLNNLTISIHQRV